MWAFRAFVSSPFIFPEIAPRERALPLSWRTGGGYTSVCSDPHGQPPALPVMFPKFLLKNGTGRIAALAKGQPAAIRVSPLLSDAAEKDADEVLRLVGDLVRRA